MTRVSKKDRLKRCPRRPKAKGTKTGPKKDNLERGYKEHTNGYGSESNALKFIPKIA